MIYWRTPIDLRVSYFVYDKSASNQDQWHKKLKYEGWAFIVKMYLIIYIKMYLFHSTRTTRFQCLSDDTPHI